MMQKTLAVILAGGLGERLSVLAQERAKPAVPFAGKYRIIDFTLSNCANSGIHRVFVLTQYNPLSLAEHIGVGMPWGLVAPAKSVRLLQPYFSAEEGRDWYKGTADAVFQNLSRFEVKDVENVFILSGDHVYQMDYNPMLEFHMEHDADITLAVTPFPEESLQDFGTVVVGEDGQVMRFQEKVKNPQSNLVSMGVYLFKREALRRCLEQYPGSDFGRNVFPKMIKNYRMSAYNFEGYWRDVGTVRAYWQTSMDVMEKATSYLFQKDWPIRTLEEERPPTIFKPEAGVTNSLVCEGCVINGSVENSVLSPGVSIATGAVVRNSIIMNDVIIGRNATVDYSILDKEVLVEAGARIGAGDDFTVNKRYSKYINTGITIIGKRARIHSGYVIGRNCVIHHNVATDDFPGSELASGTTVKPKKSRGRR